MATLRKFCKRIFGNKRRRLIIIAAAAVAVIAVSVTLGVLLTAKKDVTVDLILHHHDGKETVIKITQGDDVALPTPERTHYTFEGWYFEEKAVRKVDSSFFAIFDYSADLHLYESWRITDPVTITFNVDGGSRAESKRIPRNTALETVEYSIKDGFTLIGWCYDSTLTTFYLPNTKITDNLTLYAKWLPNEISDEDIAAIMLISDGSVYDELTFKIGTKMPLPEPIREGYNFEGWYTDTTYGYRVSPDNVVVRHLTLYARWTENPALHRITLELRGGESAPLFRDFRHAARVFLSTFNIPVKQNDEFVGWFIDDKLEIQAENEFYIYENLTLYAKYFSDTLEYTEEVTVYYRWGTGSDARNTIYGEKADKFEPLREEFDFAGWYEDSGYTSLYNFERAVTGEITLYAKWTPKANFIDDNFVFQKVADEYGEYYIVLQELNDAATEITIPDTFNDLPVRGITQGLFKNRVLLEKVTIGKNIRLIGESAFAESGVKTLIIHSNDIEFGKNAFYKANRLESLTVNGSAVIEEAAFAECISLITVKVTSDVKIGKEAFFKCTNLDSANIPHISAMGMSVFEGCSRLSQVVMDRDGAKITEIPLYSFRECTSLETFLLPQSVEVIKTSSFENSGLKEILLEYVKEVESVAFESCKVLEKVSIGTGVEKIVLSAFADCPKISQYIVDERNQFFTAKNGHLYSKDGTFMLKYASGSKESEFTVDSAVTEIAAICFMQADNLTKITLSENVTIVQEGAFWENANLIEIIVPVGSPIDIEKLQQEIRSIEENRQDIVVKRG